MKPFTLFFVITTLAFAEKPEMKVSSIRTPSIVRGATEQEALLTFVCNNAKRYTARSYSYGIRLPRFSLTLPQNLICRLIITPQNPTHTSPVIFRDHRGCQSPLLYIKSFRVDLGLIRGLSHRPHGSLPNDDVLLLDRITPLPKLSGREDSAPETNRSGRKRLMDAESAVRAGNPGHRREPDARGAQG